MRRVNDISKKYDKYLHNKDYLGAFLLQVPLIEVWLILILEHKLIYIHFFLLNNNTYFNYEYKADNTSLASLIGEYNKFFPNSSKKLIEFKKRRNNISHFMFESELPTIKDLTLGQDILSDLKEVNAKEFLKIRAILELIKKDKNLK